MSRVSDKLRNEIVNGKRVGGLASIVIVGGYRAFMHGTKRASCPYKMKGGWWAKYWRLGWDNAANDAKPAS